MRYLAPGVAAAHASRQLPMAMLVEMLLSSPLRLTSAAVNITYQGVQYLGAGHLGAVEEVRDSPGEYKNLVFSLSGVDLGLISIAMQEPIRGKPVTLRLATFDPTTLAVLDAPPIWTGSLDQMPLELTTESGIINVTAEHRGVTFSRRRPLSYTHDDQQRLFPGDTSLKTIQSQAVAPPRVWPAASFFRI